MRTKPKANPRREAIKRKPDFMDQLAIAGVRLFRNARTKLAKGSRHAWEAGERAGGGKVCGGLFGGVRLKQGRYFSVGSAAVLCRGEMGRRKWEQRIRQRFW
jgi:hypothetical protein